MAVPGGIASPCARSALTCQNVTTGYQRIDAVRSGPGGSVSQSGRANSRSGDHHTTGSEACCKNSTRGPSHGGVAIRAISAGYVACENRTVRPLS